MEMLFTGTPISAHDALLHGLVSKVVPEEELEEKTLAMARQICQTSRPVIALGKSTFQRSVFGIVTGAPSHDVMFQNVFTVYGLNASVLLFFFPTKANVSKPRRCICHCLLGDGGKLGSERRTGGNQSLH